MMRMRPAWECGVTAWLPARVWSTAVAGLLPLSTGFSVHGNAWCFLLIWRVLDLQLYCRLWRSGKVRQNSTTCNG
jgi:hypothetical protein